MHVTMDRYENDWNVVKRGLDAQVLGEYPHKFKSDIEALMQLKADNSKFNDQYCPPFVIVDKNGKFVGPTVDGDAIVTFNFRANRMIMLAKALEYANFHNFDRVRVPKIHYTMKRGSMLCFQLSCTRLVPSLHASSRRPPPPFHFKLRNVHSALNSTSSRRYAVLGAGFAGLSVAWHLLQLSGDSIQVSVDVFDEEGIGAGASGVSGGLLHPYTPKGKLVWNGVEGWMAALELLSIADSTDINLGKVKVAQHPARPMIWRRGILRPPASQKHCLDFIKFVKLSSGQHKDIAGLSCINGVEANALLPGLAISSDDCALHISEGLNIDPLQYLQGLWRACELYAERNCVEGRSCPSAAFKKLHITSLSCLADDYDAVVVCMGAGVSKLEELSGKLPLTYCRGVVAHLVLPPGKEEEMEYKGPSILGDTWIAGQGSRNVILGATKDWDNCDTSANVEAEAAATACSELFTKAATFYPPIKNWLLQGTRAGVRAMAPRTPYGKVPLIGCIDDILNYRPSRKSSCPYYWIFGGLGSRGLIYHAWLGKKLAEAVVSRNEASLPREFLLWKCGRK
ncbi:hypothetical protein GOP47_0028662 [Adiantum capillus-veneris]|nr:hypothetical protein GOP47_0028662 [Adiantum capillus-veneris]